ncbi:MAG: AMP-binding protein [Comamonadaceae bacterium]|nr:AMP-binding protein [Comamonadaceae bacterium]
MAEFFYAIGIVILEGYGLTETSPVLACNTFEKMKFGTVGPLVPEVEIKIAPDGEILAKGPNVMKGYYKKEQETREAFEDGWFKTGDIGHFDAEGFLVITDRKKDILVTAGGKNVAPQPIENLLKTNPYIQTAVVVGGGRKFISALIVPNFDKLEAYARSKGIAFGSRKELVEKEEIAELHAGRGQPVDPQPGLLRADQEGRPARPRLRRRHGADPVAQGQAPHRREGVQTAHRPPL